MGVLATIDPLTGEDRPSEEAGGRRMKLLLEQADGRTYQPYTGDARGKEHAGYYCFLYDVTADENEMNNLIASQQKGSVYDLEAVVERLAEKLCDAYGNRMVSLKYREQDWAEYSIAFEKNDNYVVSQSGWLGGKPEGW